MSKTPYTVIADTKFSDELAHAPMSELVTPVRNFLRVEFKDIVFEGLSSERMCFTYCIFIGCAFSECCFDKLDLEACTFIDCSFEKMSFVQCDIKTCKWINCKMKECNFDYSLIIKSEYNNIVFTECSLRYLYLIENRFEKGKFVKSDSTQTTATLNEYNNCEFLEYSFTDGTFAYQVFNKCDFFDCKIGWATIGISYGLTSDNLTQFDLVHYFHELEVDDPLVLIRFIINQFHEANNQYRMLVVSSNFGIKKYESLILLLETLAQILNSKILQVRHEEIQFLRLILKYEFENTRIPYAITQILLERAQALKDIRWDEFSYLHSYIEFIEQRQREKLLEFEAILPMTFERDFIVTVKYTSRPPITMNEFLFSNVVGGIISKELIEYKTSTGSFIEYFTVTATFLATMRILMYLLIGNMKLFNKLLLLIAEIKDSINKLKGKRELITSNANEDNLQKFEELNKYLDGLSDRSIYKLADEYSSKLVSVEIIELDKIIENSSS